MAGQCKVRMPAGVACSRVGLWKGALREGCQTSEMPCVKCTECVCAGLTPAVRASFSCLAFSILSFVMSASTCSILIEALPPFFIHVGIASQSRFMQPSASCLDASQAFSPAAQAAS